LDKEWERKGVRKLCVDSRCYYGDWTKCLKRKVWWNFELKYFILRGNYKERDWKGLEECVMKADFVVVIE